MSNEMFTMLPSVTSATTSDIICAVQGGVSVQETLGQVATLFNSNVILNYPGNPNGNLAGTTFQFCWDTTDKFLFVCTSTGSSSSAVWTPVIGQLTNGQLAIGSTGGVPVAANLTAGTNISISNAAGNITINSTGLAGIGFNHITGTAATMAPDAGYMTDNAGLVTLTLPSVAAFGTLQYVQGFGVGGWKVAQNSGQNIQFGSSATTTGTGGYIASTGQYDSMVLFCAVANTTWTVLGAPQSLGLTVV